METSENMANLKYHVSLEVITWLCIMYIVYRDFLLYDDALLLNVLVNHMQFKRGKNHSVKDLSNISLFLAAFSSNFCFLFSASASFPSAFSANSDLGISKDDH